MLQANLLQCITLVDVLRLRAQQNTQKSCCIFLNRGIEEVMTYGTLDLHARAIAATLKAQGAQPGDRVLLMLAPGLSLIQAFFGCLYAGCIAIPTSPPLQSKLQEKSQRIIENAKPSFVLMNTEHLEKFTSPHQDGCPTFNNVPCIALDKIDLSMNHNWYPLPLTGQDIAFLQYTSGSTMHPKGVMVGHNNLLDNLNKIYHAFAMNDETIGLSWLPPHHDMGLIGYILTPIYAGITTILMTPFSFLQNPLSWLQNISKYRATISGSPNFAYEYCVKRIKDEKKQGLDLSSWLVASNGAEPIGTQTMNKFYQAFKDYGFHKEAFYPCYGLAEATLLVAGGVPSKKYNTLTLSKEKYQDHRVHFTEHQSSKGHNLVSCGKMLQEVKIVDPDTLTPCNTDQIGEIWVKGPSVTQGYWEQPKETDHAYHGKIKGDNSPGFYLRTGDLGFIHEDELYVTGRLKDLIILYGKNHYPQDIEFTLHHAPFHNQLGKCAAFVIQADDEYQLTVMCEIRNSFIKEHEQQELFKAINRLIYQAHQLEVHTIVLIPLKSMPHTTSGKIRRNFCRKHLLDKTLPTVASWKLNSRGA